MLPCWSIHFSSSARVRRSPDAAAAPVDLADDAPATLLPLVPAPVPTGGLSGLSVNTYRLSPSVTAWIRLYSYVRV